MEIQKGGMGMANKKTQPLDEKEVIEILNSICDGFGVTSGGCRPNERIAVALNVQANTGLRISDVLKLTMENFYTDAQGKYRLRTVEQKTGKEKNIPVNPQFVLYMMEYAKRNHINDNESLFAISERRIQIVLKKCCEFLNIPKQVGTHSFRKFYAQSMYEKSGNDVNVVKTLLNHSSISITQRYLAKMDEKAEKLTSDHIIGADIGRTNLQKTIL